MKDTVRLRAVIERKDPSLPRFIVVPSSELKRWSLDGTTPVVAAIDGIDIGRRNLKLWGKGRDCWFIDLTEPNCNAASVDTGDRVRLELRPASEALPSELADLLASSPKARALWDGQTPGRRRGLIEYVLSAKRPETRMRRAEKARSLSDLGARSEACGILRPFFRAF